MISLQNYVLINETLNTNNIQYKINTWFYNNPDQQDNWNNIINQTKINHGNLSEDVINNYFLNFKHVKNFIDYLTDNVFGNEINDYHDTFKIIIKYISTI